MRKDWFEVLSELGQNAVFVDWKAEPTEVLEALRDFWGTTYAILDADKLSSLSENYAAETSELFLPALGQELSTLNLSLYEVIQDSDDNCLLIVADEENEAFQKQAKVLKIKVRAYLQSRKKPGEAARRLKLSATVPHQKYPILHFGLRQAGDFVLVEQWDVPCSWLSLKNWPPEHHNSQEGIRIHNVAYDTESGVIAALLFDKKLEEKEQVSLKLTCNPFDEEEWKEVHCDDILDELSSIQFFGDDLLIAGPNSVWLVPNAIEGGRICEKLNELPTNTNFNYPGFANSGDGRNWVVLSGRLFEYKNHTLLPQNFNLQEYVDFQAMPSEKGFIYITKTGLMVELNVTTGEETGRLVEHMDSKTTIGQLKEDWAILLRWGNEERSLDIAQFWHVPSDTWIRIPYGALGKYGLRNVWLTENDELWGESSNLLIRMGNYEAFIGQLKAMIKKPVQPAEWFKLS